MWEGSKKVKGAPVPPGGSPNSRSWAGLARPGPAQPGPGPAWPGRVWPARPGPAQQRDIKNSGDLGELGRGTFGDLGGWEYTFGDLGGLGLVTLGVGGVFW